MHSSGVKWKQSVRKFYHRTIVDLIHYSHLLTARKHRPCFTSLWVTHLITELLPASIFFLLFTRVFVIAACMLKTFTPHFMSFVSMWIMNETRLSARMKFPCRLVLFTHLRDESFSQRYCWELENGPWQAKKYVIATNRKRGSGFRVAFYSYPSDAPPAFKSIIREYPRQWLETHEIR